MVFPRELMTCAVVFQLCRHCAVRPAFILVSRGRAPFGQHQDQRSAAPWELEAGNLLDWLGLTPQIVCHVTNSDIQK